MKPPFTFRRPPKAEVYHGLLCIAVGLATSMASKYIGYWTIPIYAIAIAFLLYVAP